MAQHGKSSKDEEAVLLVISDYLTWIVEQYGPRHEARWRFYEKEWVEEYLKRKK